MILVKHILALGLIVFTHAAVWAQEGEDFWDNNIGHRAWSIALEPNDRARMISLWNAIGEDLKNDQNELAGTYVKEGNSSGYFLRWSLRKGFVVIPYFDQNLITDFGYGSVRYVDSSKVIFTPERDLHGGRGLAKMPREWTALFEYLVPVESLKDFGEYRAGLGEYNEFNGQCCDFSPSFLVARIDRLQMTRSFPIPDRYRHFFKEPITGEITAVQKARAVKKWGYDGKLYSHWIERAVLHPVRMSVGRRNGVRPHMLFRMIGEPSSGRYLEVIRVGLKESSGFVVEDISGGDAPGFYRDSETNQQKAFQTIKAGIRITTSPVVD